MHLKRKTKRKNNPRMTQMPQRMNPKGRVVYGSLYGLARAKPGLFCHNRHARLPVPFAFYFIPFFPPAPRAERTGSPSLATSPLGTYGPLCFYPFKFSSAL